MDFIIALFFIFHFRPLFLSGHRPGHLQATVLVPRFHQAITVIGHVTIITSPPSSPAAVTVTGKLLVTGNVRLFSFMSRLGQPFSGCHEAGHGSAAFSPFLSGLPAHGHRSLMIISSSHTPLLLRAILRHSCFLFA